MINILLRYLGFEPMSLKEMIICFFSWSAILIAFVYYVLFIY